jgi:predicted DNA-binding transcriptional regulator AlpA
MHSAQEKKAQAQTFATGSQIRIRYGISDMTLWRWAHDPALGFPRPVYINRRRYWRLAEVEAWERSRARARSMEETER